MFVHTWGLLFTGMWYFFSSHNLFLHRQRHVHHFTCSLPFFTAAYTYERKSLENADCLRSIINNKIFHFLENAILRKNYLLALWYFLVWAKSYKIVFIIKHLWAPEDGKAMEKTQKWVISLSWFIKSYCENIKLSKVIGGSSRKKWISVVSEETKFTKVRSRTYC